jgi:hypothetical protein
MILGQNAKSFNCVFSIENERKPLFGLAKRRQQPERYVQLRLNLVEILNKNIDK